MRASRASSSFRPSCAVCVRCMRRTGMVQVIDMAIQSTQVRGVKGSEARKRKKWRKDKITPLLLTRPVTIYILNLSRPSPIPPFSREKDARPDEDKRPDGRGLRMPLFGRRGIAGLERFQPYFRIRYTCHVYRKGENRRWSPLS